MPPALSGALLATLAALMAGCAAGGNEQPSSASWLAGDHHVHSHYSVEWDESESPPAPLIGGEASYPIERLARMARAHGLRWIVVTDHGGPNQSRLNRDRAYPELLRSRAAVPDLLQFHGTEFDVPGAKHATVIVPRTPDEADVLYRIESGFARKDAWPRDRSRDTDTGMSHALNFMNSLAAPPVMIVNHPGRTIDRALQYGLDSPERMRDWNGLAPNVVIGMEGSPGHQAMALSADGATRKQGFRADYDLYPTLGGYDVMTARLGGLWDSLLGEGRRWWVTASSDVHLHYTEGGRDFWPGEYSKTYVFARPDYRSVLDALRSGKAFAVTGDLITALEVTVSAEGSVATAGMGGTLSVAPGSRVRVAIRFRDPSTSNGGGFDPAVARVDLISGQVRPPSKDRSLDYNETARVVRRFTAAEWRPDADGYTSMSLTFPAVERSFYVRVRGTNTGETEPRPDVRGENPWDDLWFYGNPVFVDVE